MKKKILWQLEFQLYGDTKFFPAIEEPESSLGGYVISEIWDCVSLRNQWRRYKAKSWVKAVRLVAWSRSER